MIRLANINDIEMMSKIHVDTWLTTYEGIIPTGYLSKLSYSKSKEMFENLLKNKINEHIVAEIDSNIVGFASFGKERTGNYLYQGEIQAIYILKEYQNKGIGKKMFIEIIEHFKQNDINSMILWALEANKYINFYKKLGGEIIDWKNVKFDNVVLKEVAFGWTNL